MTWTKAGIAAVGAAIAVTATVLVTSSSSVNANGTGTNGKGAGETVLMAAMQRDLSLTPQQSNARLKKEAWASGTERKLREALGTEFGGAWMSKNNLMVGVTTEAAADTVRAAGAKPKLVDQGESELTSLKKRLDAAKAADSTVTGWYVDPRSNSLVVVAQPGGKAAAEKLIAAGDVPSDAVRVVTAAGSPKPLSDVRGADPYFINDQFRCSIGFSVVGGFVTAGHCGVPGDTTTDAANQPQGVVKASVFPGTGDFGFVETNADQTLLPVVATSEGVLPVAGSEEAPIGAAICRSGSTTGTRCGVVEAKNATVNYPEGSVTGLTQTDVCAEGGDSGGSWLSGDQAQGVTSGGSGDCTVGGTTFFQPIAEILEVDNLQLLTTADAAPPATDPPATDPPATDPPATDPPATDPATDDPPAADEPATECPAADAAVESSLRRTGSQQVAPAKGFRTSGGTLHACLTGPSGADFDLSLQELTRKGWRTVAQSDSDSAVEELTFRSQEGTFRFAVSSVRGSGSYALAIGAP